MKKFPLWQKCLLVIALLTAWYLWYTRPQTLEQLTPGFNWDGVIGIQGLYHPSVMQDFHQTDYISISDGEATIQPLIQSLRGVTVRRSMNRNEFYGIPDGPIRIAIYLRSGQTTLNLTLYGDYLTIDFSGPDAPTRARKTCALTDQSPNWQDWVAFIDAHRKP